MSGRNPNYGRKDNFQDNNNNKNNRNNSGSNNKNNINKSGGRSSDKEIFFSSGNAAQWMRASQRIQQQIKIDNTEKIFSGQKKPFSKPKPTRTFRFSGGNQRVALPMATDYDSDDSEPETRIPKTSHHDDTTLAGVARDLNRRLSSIPNPNLASNTSPYKFENLRSRFTSAGLSTPAFPMGWKNPPDDDDDDEPGDEDDENYGQRFGTPDEEDLIPIDNYMDYLKAEGHFQDLLSAWKKAKVKSKDLFSKARSMLVDHFSGFAASVMAPYLALKSDENICLALRALDSSMLNTQSNTDAETLLGQLSSMSWHDHNEPIILFSSKFDNIVKTLEEMGSTLSSTIHANYFKTAVKRLTGDTYDECFSSAKLIIKLTNVKNYWDKHRLLIDQLIEKQKEVDSDRRSKQKDARIKANVAKQISNHNNNKDNNKNKPTSNNNNNDKSNNNKQTSNYSEQPNSKYPHYCAKGCGFNRTHDTEQHDDSKTPRFIKDRQSQPTHQAKVASTAEPSISKQSVTDIGSKVLNEETERLRNDYENLQKTLQSVTAAFARNSRIYDEDEDDEDNYIPVKPANKGFKFQQAKMSKAVKTTYRANFANNDNSKHNGIRIISDSGCTALMSPDINNFDIKSMRPDHHTIELGDGKVIYSHVSGTFMNCFPNVLYAPDLKDTLIPIDYFVDKKLKVEYYLGIMNVIYPPTGEVVLWGTRATDKLYDIDKKSFRVFEQFQSRNLKKRALRHAIDKTPHIEDLFPQSDDLTPYQDNPMRLVRPKDNIINKPSQELPINDKKPMNQPENTTTITTNPDIAENSRRGPEPTPNPVSEAERIALSIGKRRNIQIAVQMDIPQVLAYIKAAGHISAPQILHGLRHNAFTGHGLTIEAVKKYIKKQVPDENLILATMRSKPIAPSIYSSKEAAMHPKLSLKSPFVERPPAQPPPFIDPIILTQYHPFNCICMDPQGPFPTRSMNHNKYTFQYIDEATSFRFSYDAKTDDSKAFITSYEKLLHTRIILYGYENFIT